MMPHGLRFAELHAPDPGAEALLRHHHALMREGSPEGSCHVMSAAELRAHGARIFVGRDPEGQVMAVGGFVEVARGGAELKSMHCHHTLRGKGAGRGLLEHLIAAAQAAGFRSLWLETGTAPAFDAARGLYCSAGFAPCPPFGGYVPDPLSVFMRRDI